MKLVLGNESDFKRELMVEEVEALNDKFPLEESKFDFKINYIVENEYDYEVEFYFRNNVAMNLILGKLPLHFIYEESVIAIKVVDFKKEFGTIPAKSIKACSFKINKESVYYPEFMEQSILVLGVGLEYDVKEVVSDNIINMPDNLSYDQELYFKEKIKELPALTVNSYNINCLTLAADSEGNIDLIIIVRNGYDSEISVERLPIQILNDIKIPIYIGEFNPTDMIVKAKESKLYLIKIKKDDIIKSYSDYSSFEVKIG